MFHSLLISIVVDDGYHWGYKLVTIFSPYVLGKDFSWLLCFRQRFPHFSSHSWFHNSASFQNLGIFASTVHDTSSLSFLVHCQNYLLSQLYCLCPCLNSSLNPAPETQILLSPCYTYLKLKSFPVAFQWTANSLIKSKILSGQARYTLSTTPILKPPPSYIDREPRCIFLVWSWKLHNRSLAFCHPFTPLTFQVPKSYLFFKFQTSSKGLSCSSFHWGYLSSVQYWTTCWLV